MGHREVPTVRYFAIGFFTAENLEKKHRAMLARAVQAETALPRILSSVFLVHVTIYKIDTGTETVGMGVTGIPSAMEVLDPTISANGVSFRVESFDSDKFPNGRPLPDAFKAYLASTDGIAAFGHATAVQLFSIDVEAKNDDP